MKALQPMKAMKAITLSTCSAVLLGLPLMAPTAQANGHTPSHTEQERAEIVSDLIGPNPTNSSRIVVRCHHSASSSASSTIRDVISQRANQQTLTIEVQGACHDERLGPHLPPVIVVPYPQPAYPQPTETVDFSQLLEDWADSQVNADELRWILRPGSGWHWLLHQQQNN